MTSRQLNYRAAGGVVLHQSRVLLIERTIEGLHEVRLPKGHIEPNETTAEAAVREVCEETGYCDLRIVADLGWQTVTFPRGDDLVVRDEFYFVMVLNDARAGAPSFTSQREALFSNRWADSLQDAEELLTFDAEKSVIRRARQWRAIASADSLSG